MANFIPSEALLGFYRNGLFPMAGEDGIRLYSPDPRGVLPLRKFRIPHGTRKTLRDPAWDVRVDTAFAEVLVACASREETWIDETILLSYLHLHAAGHAHSIEVWRDGTLAGGLYGVRIGAAFFGESMFHHVPGASKVALCWLAETLRDGGFTLLDTQWTTPHLAMFGGMEIPRSQYMQALNHALSRTAAFPSPGPLLEMSAGGVA